MNHYFDQVTEAIAEGRRIDAFTDRWSQLCVEKWERGIRDPLFSDTILSYVHSRRAKIMSGHVIPFRRARFRNGTVRLGRDLAVSWHLNGEIWVPGSYFGTPWLVMAGSGHGKSVLAANQSLFLAKTGPKIWQLSYWKDDLLGQLRRFQREGLELVVLRAEDLKFNPLQAGSNDPRTHLTAVTSRLTRCLYDLPPRADLLLRAVCHEVYREFGIFDGQRERWPTLFRVYREICTRKGLNIPARDALLDRLGSFLERYSPRCGAWLKGWEPSDLAKHSILFLFRRAGRDVKDFVLESLLDHVFQHQVERGVVNGKLELCIFVDDAQTLVNSQGSSAMSGLDQQVGRNRGGGISIVFFVQTLQGVSAHLLPNVNGWLMGRTVQNDARMTLGRNIGLNDAQIEFVRLSLQRGQFVGAFAEGDYHEPFAFEAKNVDLAHDVTEAEVLASQLPLAALPVIPDDDFQHWERHPVVELQPDTASPALSTGETRLLNLVAAEPGKPAGYYTRKLGMNGKTARAARERLVQLGLLRQHKLQLNSRGKPAIVLEPLPAAAGFSTTPTEAI
jgi:hypothetical protein